MEQQDRCTALQFDKQTGESRLTSFPPNRKMQ